MKLSYLVLNLFLFLSIEAFSKDVLLIKERNNKKLLSIQEIVSNEYTEELKNVTIQAYPGIHFNLLGIKLCRLLNNVKKIEAIKIVAKDKYYIYLKKNDLSGCDISDGLIPYLALQEHKNNWPEMKRSHEEVGAFSLVWLGSSSGKISKEKWIRNISKLEIVTEKDETQSIKLPNIKLNKDQENGFNVFRENCAGCHSLNLNGQLNIGPDLNYPMNPLEYFTVATFKKFVRNPENIRYFKNSKMEGFDVSDISEEELENLVTFMKVMSNHK